MDLVKNPGSRVVISLEMPGSGDLAALDANVVPDRDPHEGAAASAVRVREMRCPTWHSFS